MYRIALVSGAAFPFPPASGLGAYVTATARVLAADAEVTIVTSDRHERRYESLRAESSPDLPEGVRFAFVREPTAEEADADGYFGARQLWSARALEKLKELYPDGGPEIAEFPDRFGESAVTVQACNTLDPGLLNTLVCVRLHGTSEIRDVLNRGLSRDVATGVACDLERYALAHADRVLWPGGDVLEAYRRYYRGAITEAECVRQAVLPTSREARPPVTPDEPARLLYVGPLERRKGVQNLCRALTGLDRNDWHLTLVGRDTRTAPLGSSMLTQLRLATADDERFEFRDSVPREGILRLFAESDLLVSPSLWECWPSAVLEALSQDLPVLATPVGGHVELVEAGSSGWLASDRDEGALAMALEQVLDRRDELRTLADSGEPRRRFERLTSAEAVREGYADLADRRSRRTTGRTASTAPLVSVVIPYFMLDEHLEETLESVRAQTYPRLEVIVVNDGSFRPEDGRLLDAIGDRYGATLLTQQNSGLGRARNLGISQSRGEYVVPLDPDDLLEPRFVERCAAVLENRPELAYVNTWSRYIAEDGGKYGSGAAGYRPFSNEGTSLSERNVAGPATALIRRRVFEAGLWYSVDSTSYEDWLLYQELAAAGLIGHTIPEQLFVYRVRKQSMFRALAEPHHERLLDELANHRRERAVQWSSGPSVREQANQSSPPARAASAVERLEQANRELASTNARLARSKWAKADSAAASLVAKLELERRTLEEQRLHDETKGQAQLREIDEVREWALDLERQLHEIRATRAWRLASGYWTARATVKRALRGRGGG